MKVRDKWLLYYTANHRKRDVQCLGVAAADNPGARSGRLRQPLVCQFDLGGTIDANPFRDKDGKLYLYYKSDGNRVGKKTVIWGQRLSDDGLSVVGAPAHLVEDDQKWMEAGRGADHGALARRPPIIYSAAFYGWDPNERLSRYATGYATARAARAVQGRARKSDPQQLQRQGGRLPQRPRPYQHLRSPRPSFHRLPRLGGDQRLPQGGRQALPHVAPLFWKDGKPQIGLGLREKTN